MQELLRFAKYFLLTAIHSGYFGHVPFWKVWIEITSFVKHAFHSCYRDRIPIWQILVEHRCVFKHCKKARVQQERKIKTSKSSCFIKNNVGWRYSTLTAIHRCHRTRVPFWHVLIEHRCGRKHCKRGVQQRKKEQTTTTIKSTFQKTKANRSCENCD